MPENKYHLNENNTSSGWQKKSIFGVDLEPSIGS